MRRWLAVPVLALAVLAACGEGDDVSGEGDEAPVLTGEIGTAVEVARLSLPQSLDDAAVAGLVEGMCDAAGSDLVDPLVTQLIASEINPDDLSGAVDALAAGAGTYCPDDVDAVVPRVQQALSPATTVPTAAAGAAGEQATGGTGAGGGSSTRSAATSGSGTSGTSASGSGSTSNGSSGSAGVGGGNASGTGNSSSTDFTQGVSSSNSSSSGGGSSSASATTG